MTILQKAIKKILKFIYTASFVEMQEIFTNNPQKKIIYGILKNINQISKIKLTFSSLFKKRLYSIVKFVKLRPRNVAKNRG